MCNLSTSALTNASIEIEPEEFFDSVFSYGKLKGTSLTFPGFVVLYLKLFQNIDQMSEKHIYPLLLH